MLTFKQFLIREAKQLSRVLSHLKNDPYVIIMSVERSPYENVTKEMTDDQIKKTVKQGRFNNTIATGTFRELLRGAHCGFIPVLGTYKETLDNGIEVEVEEKSQIIYCTNTNADNLFDLCIRQAKRTNQDSILVAKHGIGYLHYLKDVDGHRNGDIVNVGPFHPLKVDRFVTKLKSNYRQFEFSNKVDVDKNIAKYLGIE